MYKQWVALQTVLTTTLGFTINVYLLLVRCIFLIWLLVTVLYVKLQDSLYLQDRSSVTDFLGFCLPGDVLIFYLLF